MARPRNLYDPASAFPVPPQPGRVEQGAVEVPLPPPPNFVRRGDRWAWHL